MFLISPPSTPCTPKVQNQDQNVSMPRISNLQAVDMNALTPLANTNVLSDASTISLDLVTAPNNLLQPKSNLKLPLLSQSNESASSNEKLQHQQENETDCTKNEKNPDIIEAIQMKNKSCVESSAANNDNSIYLSSNTTSRKRQSSSVTYNVNVINFGDDDGNEGTAVPLRGSGARSNSSTSM